MGQITVSGKEAGNIADCYNKRSERQEKQDNKNLVEKKEYLP